MPRLTFIQADGERHSCEVRSGASVMDSALDNGVPGIIAQCGGGCTCATCHCFIREPWFSLAGPPGREELELLACLRQRQSGSRLACQVRVLELLDGMVVHLPPAQE